MLYQFKPHSVIHMFPVHFVKCTIIEFCCSITVYYYTDVLCTALPVPGINLFNKFPTPPVRHHLPQSPTLFLSPSPASSSRSPSSSVIHIDIWSSIGSTVNCHVRLKFVTLSWSEMMLQNVEKSSKVDFLIHVKDVKWAPSQLCLWFPQLLFLQNIPRLA